MSDTWEEAVQEWDIVSEREDEGRAESCMCGHEHLRYLFTIRNRYSGNDVYPIGSTRIKKCGRDDLNEDLDRRMQALQLMREAVRIGRGNIVEIDSCFYSRKLIWHMEDRGAFRRRWPIVRGVGRGRRLSL